MLSGIVIVTMSPSVFAQDANPCDGFTCHDNSKCAVRGGTSVCICDKGYEANPAGFGCRYESPIAVEAPVVSEPPPPLKTKADKLIISGAVLTGVGGIGLIIGGALIKNERDNYDPDEWFAGLGAAIYSISLMPTFGVVLVTGIVLLSVGLAKRKKMERNSLAFDIKTKHGKVTLEPTFAASENGGVFGLSGRF
jgi:hypothetical protein